MRKHRQKGKVTITTILFFVVLFYAGFVVVKIISANLTKSQVKNEIIDKFGYIRGNDFAPEEGEKIILQVLKDNGVLPADENYDFEDDEETVNQSKSGLKAPEIYVEFNKKSAEIVFFVEYEYEVSLVLFKYKKIYTIEDKMRSYN